MDSKVNGEATGNLASATTDHESSSPLGALRLSRRAPMVRRAPSRTATRRVLVLARLISLPEIFAPAYQIDRTGLPGIGS